MTQTRQIRTLTRIISLEGPIARIIGDRQGERWIYKRMILIKYLVRTAKILARREKYIWETLPNLLGVTVNYWYKSNFETGLGESKKSTSATGICHRSSSKWFRIGLLKEVKCRLHFFLCISPVPWSGQGQIDCFFSMWFYVSLDWIQAFVTN